MKNIACLPKIFLFLPKKVSSLPHLYYFNPTCELAVANGSPHYTAPQHLCRFESSLTPLMAVFCLPGDFILTEKKPSEKFQLLMQEYHISTAKYLTFDELNGNISASIPVIPWGKSPAASYRLKQAGCTLDWSDQLKVLYSRISSLDFLTNFLRNNPLSDYPSVRELPVTVSKISRIEALMRNWGQVVLKAPYSSSGRGLLVLRKQQLNISNRQWIDATLKQQQLLTAERWLDKTVDLSFQFKREADGNFNFLGYTFFTTNTNGQYQGHLLHQFPITEEQQALLETTGRQLSQALDQSIYALHEGFLGIDALFYRTATGQKLFPCLEINSRMNMGILSMKLEKLIHPDARGTFHIYYHPRGSFQQFIKEAEIGCPRIKKDEKLRKGILPLTDYESSDTLFGAYLQLP